MKDWEPSFKTLYGWPCVEQGEELTLAGMYGEIYEFSSELAACIVLPHKNQNKTLQRLGGSPGRGDFEGFLKIKNDQVPLAIQLLKIPKDRIKQSHYANTFSQR